MKSYEWAEARKARQENKLDSAILQQDDGSWTMSLMNSSKEISVVALPDVDAPIVDGTCAPDEVCQDCGEHIDYCECGQYNFHEGEDDDFEDDDDFICGDPNCPNCGGGDE